MSDTDGGQGDTFIPAGIMTVDKIGADKRVPARLTKKFEPKTWKPIYDTFVYHHCLGRSNKWIAEEYGYTPQQICNILTSTQGKILKGLLSENLRNARERRLDERMEDVGDKFMKRIEAVADDDALFEKAPFAVIDRGLAVIRSIREKSSGSSLVKVSDGQGGSTIINNVQNNDNRRVTVIGEKAVAELRDAIRFSDEVNAMHGLISDQGKDIIQNQTEVKKLPPNRPAIGTPITETEVKKVG